MPTIRLTRLLGPLAAALLLALISPWGASAAAQSATAQRFEIVSVADTTFSFSVKDQKWVKAKATGIAIDPRQRDALIARFEVLSVRDGVATALVTGATSRVTRDHLAQLEAPRPRWWRSGAAWAGAVVGLIAGVGIGKSI